MVRVSNSWGVPAHITGLFRIVQNDDLLRMGSLGAGFSIDRLILTTVRVKPSKQPKIAVFFNEEPINGKVSIAVAEQFNDHLKDLTLEIHHKSDLPMQAGFGTSGAGALGTAFALNDILATEKTALELGQIAHLAEVQCRTGLGDVLAQMTGKAEVRVKAGAPGVGETIFLDWPAEKMILTVTLGVLSTKKIITNPEMIQRINHYSTNLLAHLRANPVLEEFLEASYHFAVKTGLMTEKVQALLNKVMGEGYKASMIMLGQSIFVVGTKEELYRCQRLITENYPKAKTWLDSLAQKGPRKVK